MHKNTVFFIPGLIAALIMALAPMACDSGEKVVDEVTGNRAVKQFHQSKEDLSDIADRQDERFKDIPEEEETPDEQGR